MRKISKVVFILCFLFSFLSVFFVGYLVGHGNLKFEDSFQPKIVNKELFKPKELDFGLFWEAWSKLEENYSGTFDRRKMLYGAISGMVNSLGDPYSVFLDPNEAKKFMEDLGGSFEGIGAELSVKDGKLVVVAPLEGTPAFNAGIKSGDEILKIDNEIASEMTLEQAVSKIRGSKGTKVTLLINREGFSEPKAIEIIRGNIIIKSVKLEWKDDNIAYLKVNQFGSDTVDLAKQAADEIRQKQAKGVIVDMRNNPGGYLNGAIDFSSLFIDQGVVVIEKTKKGEQKSSVTEEAKLKDIPLVVLVNKGSASASEIFAGAMLDHKRGILIGEQTFGKGSVQSLEKLEGGSDLRLTIAEWLTPNGNAINHIGIKPDIEVKMTEDDINNKKDPQLDRALLELKK